MMLTTFALAALLAPLETPSTLGDGFRCPAGRLVSVGDRLVEVRERCGEPDASQRRTETRRQVASNPAPVAPGPIAVPVVTEETVTVEEWTYDLGDGRLSRHLTFENGRLLQVTTGTRTERKPRP